jgi:arylsulfatase A-like enzyme
MRRVSQPFASVVRAATPFAAAVLAALFSVAPVRAQRPWDAAIVQLTSADAASRFAAAATLVQMDRVQKVIDSSFPGLHTEVSRAAEREPLRRRLRDSKEARAAVDFVLLELSGGKPAAAVKLDDKRPHVILISLDTVRADHLSCYGYERKTTPQLDRLAADGAVFLNAISPSSWTLPVHMSMLTSLYPSFHKLEWATKIGSVKLDESETTLAQQLRADGYTTAAIVTHTFLAAEWGFDRGFDLYFRDFIVAEIQVDRALLWMDWYAFHVDRGLSEPNFFLFLHYIDPHEPYEAPVEYGRKYFPDYKGRLTRRDHMVTLFRDKEFESPDDFRYVLALYDAELSYVDEQVGRVFKRLEELGWADNTLIIVTSDHGEEFKDHGSMGHKQTLYDEQLKVPLILRYPRAIEAGQRIPEVVSLLDIAPTVSAMTGTKPLARAQGVSLTSYMRTKASYPSARPDAVRHVFAELGPLDVPWEQKFRRKAVRAAQYKLIYDYGEGGAVKKELYDVSKDPDEKQDVYAEKKDADEVRRLEQQLEAFVQRGIAYKKETGPGKKIEIDEDVAERMRALGYVE